MNILFIFDQPMNPNKGGIERVSRILADCFNERNHKSFFLCLNKDVEKRIEKFGDYSQYYLDINDLNIKEEVNKIIIKNNIDIIICQNIIPSFFPILKGIDKNIKKVTVLHNKPFANKGMVRRYKKQTYPKTLKGKLIKYITICFPQIYENLNNQRFENNILETLKISNKLYFLSDLYVDRIKKILPHIDSSKLDAINNPNTFDFDNIENANLEKENIILFVGRLDGPQKNVKGFIDVWKEFNKLHPDWKAQILGDGPDRYIFEKYTKKKRVKNLEFTGNRKDIDKFYEKAKIICMTSLYEGWPMVLPEAIAYGCIPVVYDSFEAVSEVVENDKSGCIVKAFDKSEMVDCLDKIASNESKRLEMAQEGKKKIKEFSPEKISDIWLHKISRL